MLIKNIIELKKKFYNVLNGPIRPGLTDTVFTITNEYYMAKEKVRVVTIGDETWFYKAK